MSDPIRIALLVLSLGAAAHAQVPALAHTSAGIEMHHRSLTLQVDALRPDVLRVRIFPDGRPAEDASWAVLPESRKARIQVTPTDTGFTTSALQVHLSSDMRLTVMDLQGNTLQDDAMPVAWSADGFKVTKVRTPDDHFFGLGDKPGPLDRTGEDFVMWNTDASGWQSSSDPLYKSVPFFLEMHNGRTIGILFDNTFRTFFDFGHERSDRYSFSAPAGPLDYYLLYGPEPKQVVQTYAWLTGPSALPPLWALGFQQSRYSYYPQSQVEDIATHLRRDRIPTDVLWLDIDYQFKNRPFTIDRERFPDFSGMIHTLAANHFHTVAITDLHIANLAHQDYAPYDSGKAGDHFVKKDGQDYVGEVWPGPSVFPDFTRRQTRAWWGQLYAGLMRDGVSGFWNDMNEPSVFGTSSKTMPEDVVHRIDEPGFIPRNASHAEIHNIYGMENSRGTMEGMLKIDPNLRPFVMTRATFAGGQRYAVTWTGDNSATWNHLQQTTTQLENLGLSGFSMAGADVGGFAGSPPANLLTRWIMLAAFQPIDRDHSNKGTNPHEPWVDGEEHETIRRRFIEERYRLMPYLYTAAEEASRDGVPIERPLFLEFPHATPDNSPLDTQAPGEFMFGPSILVADSPSPEEVAPYTVHLPTGLWYDYWTGARLDRTGPRAAGDNEVLSPLATIAPGIAPITVTPRLDELPVYVRSGSIIPMAPLVQSTDEKPNGPLVLRVYPPAPGGTCSGDLYQDDGLTFNFRQGDFLRLHITCAMRTDGSLEVSIPSREGHFKPWWKQIQIEVVGFRPAASQASTSVNQTPSPLLKTPLGWAVTVVDAGSPQVITLR